MFQSLMMNMLRNKLNTSRSGSNVKSTEEKKTSNIKNPDPDTPEFLLRLLNSYGRGR